MVILYSILYLILSWSRWLVSNRSKWMDLLWEMLYPSLPDYMAKRFILTRFGSHFNWCTTVTVYSLMVLVTFVCHFCLKKKLRLWFIWQKNSVNNVPNVLISCQSIKTITIDLYSKQLMHVNIKLINIFLISFCNLDQINRLGQWNAQSPLN